MGCDTAEPQESWISSSVKVRFFGIRHHRERFRALSGIGRLPRRSPNEFSRPARASKPVSGCKLGVRRQGVVVGQQFGLRGGELGRLSLQRRRNPGVDAPPVRSQQGVVGRVAQQRVPEGIVARWACLDYVDDITLREMREAASNSERFKRRYAQKRLIRDSRPMTAAVCATFALEATGHSRATSESRKSSGTQPGGLSSA